MDSPERSVLRLPFSPDWGRRRLGHEERVGSAGLGVTFGAVSQHLRVLREADFVRVRRDGTRRLYQADESRLGPLVPLLTAMWEAKLDSLANAIEEGRR